MKSTAPGVAAASADAQQMKAYYDMLLRKKKPNSATSIFRLIILSCALGYMIQKHLLRDILLPHGPALLGDEVYSPIDYNNDLLQFKHGRSQRIFERIEDNKTRPLLNGPETVLFDRLNSDVMYVLTEDANLVQLYDFQVTPNTNQTVVTAKTKIIKNLGVGRPLGGAFTYPKKKGDKNTLYIADAILGLIRVADVMNPMSKVEIVASHVVDDVVTVEKYKTKDNNTGKIVTIEEEVFESKLTPILFADDVAIGPRTGKVYFTDASNIAPDRYSIHENNPNSKASSKKKSLPKTPDGNFKAWQSSQQITPVYKEYRWDTLHASKLDLLRRGNSGSGRILEYNPVTDTVRVLARGLHFANGISVVNDEEDALFVAETFGVRLYKYNLTTERLEVLVDSSKFPGYLDGADCIHKSSRKKNGVHRNDQLHSVCYAVMPSAIPLVSKILNNVFVIKEMNRLVRTLIMTLPKFLMPNVEPFGGLIEVDMETEQHRFLLDPTGKDMQFFTGVTHHDGKLYFGSLKNNFIGVYNLDDKFFHGVDDTPSTSTQKPPKNDEL